MEGADRNPVVIEIVDKVATVTLNRPEVHNALNPMLVRKMTSLFQELNGRADVHVIVLTGRGRSFCAGADLEFMRAAADYTPSENIADGRAIFDLMLAIETCRKPVIGRINGAAIGGGVGLVSCCDIVIAMERAQFGFSEVRLGLVPAVISPFVISRIGVAHARQLFLTGERFDAEYARAIGLVNSVVSGEEAMDSRVHETVSQLRSGAPGAQAAAKKLISHVAHQPRPAVRDYTADLIAQLRAGQEGREGMSAFLEKRKPVW